MKIIDQCRITIDVGDRERIPAFDIARVETDYMDDIYAVFLEGRIKSAAKGLKRIDFHHGTRRLDLAKIGHKGAAGAGIVDKAGEAFGARFELGLNLAGAPASGTIEMHAVFGPADHVRLGRIDVQRKCIATGYQAKFSPLILNSMGRSGTTWFLHFLAEHPQIYIHPEYPHEMLAAHYWINMLESLTTPLAGDRVVSKWAMRDHQMKSVRGHVYYRRGAAPAAAIRYLGGRYVEELAAFCQRSIDSAYAALIEGADPNSGSRNAGDIRYICEKSLPLPELLKEIYAGAREVYLVRDIRDNICSALAFNKKRGTQEFGRGSTLSDEEFAAYRSREFKTLYESYLGNKSQACLVRYEDLVTDPAGTMRRVLDYLGLDNSEAIVAAMLQRASRPDAELDYHKTSSSAQRSVERWRQELPETVQRKCLDVAGNELAALNYPL